MFELEAASFVLQKASGVEDVGESGSTLPRAAGGGAGGIGLLRKPVRPALGENLDDVPRPGWWQKVAVVVRITAWLVRRPYEAARFCRNDPGLVTCGLLLVGLATAAVRWGVAPVAITAQMATGVACMAAWAVGQRWPAAYSRWLHVPVRSFARRVRVYRRSWQWALSTTRPPLTVVKKGREHWPRLGRVVAGPHFDDVYVDMLANQLPDDYGRAGQQLAQTFGVRSLRAYPVPGHPHRVRLRCLVRDPLTAPVPLPAPAAAVDLTAVPVGVREDGTPLTLPLLYSHLLVGGETGAGKGSVIWSLVAGLAPGIRAGLVKVLAVDPKGGVELSAGQPLYTSWSYGGPEETVQLLEDAVTQMRERAKRLRRRRDPEGRPVRKLVPDTAEPLIVLLVDELASLTAYVTEPELRRRITNALALLLSQGRAVGVCVVGATQDVRKDVMTLRDLFPVRVALRAAEAEQADMLLGRGARDRGAWTDRIPHATPGVGYVMVDGTPEPVRVRFFHVTDADVAALAQAARAGRVAA